VAADALLPAAAGRLRNPDRDGRDQSAVHRCGAGSAPAVGQVSIVVFWSGVSEPVGLPDRGMKSISMAIFITWWIFRPPP
jgi:hypothetical protein